MKKRILILDNDPVLLDILEALLEYEGFDTVVMQQPDNLYNVMRLYRPALILIDFVLSGHKGGEWCLRLKDNPEFASVPIIIFTAYTTKGMGKGSYGCDDFMAKPFDINALVERINTLVLNDNYKY